MRHISLSFNIIISLIFLSSSAYAAKIYKWIDEDGQIHYSANKPANNKSKSLYVPGNTNLQSSSKNEIKITDDCESITCRMNKYINNNPIPKRKKVYSYSTDSPSKKAIDNAVVEKCKKNRDIFCDQGADTIRRIDRDKAHAQREAARERRLNPPIPRYRGNDVYIQ